MCVCNEIYFRLLRLISACGSTAQGRAVVMVYTERLLPVKFKMQPFGAFSF